MGINAKNKWESMEIALTNYFFVWKYNMHNILPKLLNDHYERAQLMCL